MLPNGPNKRMCGLVLLTLHDVPCRITLSKLLFAALRVLIVMSWLILSLYLIELIFQLL